MPAWTFDLKERRAGDEYILYRRFPLCREKQRCRDSFKKHDLYYFKTDDFLDRYMQAGARKGYPVCRKTAGMSAEQVWMREPLLQCREEFDIYRDIFEFVAADLDRIEWKGGIITEGAAYLPELMKQSGVPGSRYISITPTKGFQVTHYRKRDLFLWYWKGAVIRKRLSQTGWTEMLCLRRK